MIVQSDINDASIEEIIVIGSKNKLPGFIEYLKSAYIEKKFSFLSEEKLAIGSSIAVSEFILYIKCY